MTNRTALASTETSIYDVTRRSIQVELGKEEVFKGALSKQQTLTNYFNVEQQAHWQSNCLQVALLTNQP